MKNNTDEPVVLDFNIDDFVTFQGNKKFLQSEPEPNEISWSCPNELGRGTFQRMKIRSGFDLWVSDCAFHNDVVFNECRMPVAMQFNFTLSGHYDVLFKGNQNTQQYCGEYQGIGYYNDSCAWCKVFGQTPIRYVSVTLYPDVFTACFEEYLDLMPPLIHNILADNIEGGYLYQSAITPAMREVMQQIITCPYHSITRKLFLEGKSLELLSLQLNQICDYSLLYSADTRVHPQDRKQIEGVRDLLVSNLENPPSLKELAKTAGMSHPKLNRCFKQIYGMTVFQYLRVERLNRAKIMLQKEGYSVTEAAFQVGYDSVSHFSQTYKKQFGVSPSSRQAA